jgi:predicted ATPase
VSEIDPDGKNFAMFLNSLTESRMESFSNWVKDLFGYGVEVNRTLGHITISLKYDENTVNIVDTGYGISQILPVLGQVWWANNRPQGATRFRSRGAPLLAIEQPELHLHPAHQALLADAFVSGFKFRGDRDSELGTHFLIETHSEALINRLGALILEGKLSQENVQILIFETNGTKTDVRTAIFDEEGQLIGWPYGFFQPDA